MHHQGRCFQSLSTHRVPVLLFAAQLQHVSPVCPQNTTVAEVCVLMAQKVGLADAQQVGRSLRHLTHSRGQHLLNSPHSPHHTPGRSPPTWLSAKRVVAAHRCDRSVRLRALRCGVDTVLRRRSDRGRAVQSAGQCARAGAVQSGPGPGRCSQGRRRGGLGPSPAVVGRRGIHGQCVSSARGEASPSAVRTSNLTGRR